jgi:hypothetical protein
LGAEDVEWRGEASVSVEHFGLPPIHP